MRFEKVNYELAKRIRQNNDLVNNLIEFKKSGLHCARITDHNYKSSTVARASSIINAIKREKITEIECFERNGECYLVNKLMENEKE